VASTFDEVIRVPIDVGHVAVHRRRAPGRPVALMTHGTGFCASTWLGVADLLADEFEVCSIDRRGHGLSSAPDDAYDLVDFARDAVAVIDALDLHDAYAVGHSAGATDLLLAAAERPRAFRKMFVIEPTAMDPAARGIRADMASFHGEALAGSTRRRATFAGRDQVIERYTGRGAFVGWRPDLLEAFVRDAFADEDDGSVVLRCSPAHEVSMLRRIFAAMEGAYGVPDEPSPFDAFALVTAPVHVVSTEHSSPIYRQMVDIVRRLVPGATSLHLDALGHTAAQVDPERVADEVLRFWRGDVSERRTSAPGA
jgi:pimeloyl-ACP methyl ester carboxylesterase